MEDKIEKVITEEISREVTKRYLLEAVDNIKEGYYRSAIVVLYTTMLYDILKQLEILRDFYENSNADAIITKVEKQKNNNPKSPSWEGVLIEELKNRGFITNIEFHDLEEIRRFRNYGAHPIVEMEKDKIEISLRDIQREEVELALTNALKIIFLNQLGLGSKYAEQVFQYAADYVEEHGYNEEFDNQFIDKYLKRLNKSAYKTIFKNFFREIFKESSSLENNRRNIINVLKVVYKFNPDYCQESISDDSFKLVNVLPDDIVTSNHYQKNQSKIYSLMEYFQFCPGLWEILPKDKKDIILGFSKRMFIQEDPVTTGISNVSSDARGRFIEKAKFISSLLYLVDDKEVHLKETIFKIRDNISTYRTGWVDIPNIDFLTESEISGLYAQCVYYNLLPQLKCFLFEYISNSGSYERATCNLSMLLKLNLVQDEEDIKKLLSIMNSNDQFYGATRDIRSNLDKVKKYLNDRLDIDFENLLNEYQNLNKYQKSK